MANSVVEPARPADLDALLTLLAGAALPTSGVADHFPGAYVVVRSEGALTAAAGLEVHGQHGLLRSVAVAPTHRSMGLGRALVDDRLQEARARGLGAVYLLTTTAADFFSRTGFAPVPRQSAPAALQACSEFASICPASAVCMARQP